jgi:hypothetical protein
MMKMVFVYFVFLFTIINGQEAICEPNELWSWTPWFNFHTPNSKGEFELHAAIRSRHPNIVCAEPRSVSAVNQANVHMNQTLDIIAVRSYDVFCLNSYDPNVQNKVCDDYSVRYCCPTVKNSTTTTTNEIRDMFINSNMNALVDNQPRAAQSKCGRAPSSTAQKTEVSSGFLMTLFNAMLSKIINGVETRPNNWPWVVSIGVRYRGPTGLWQNRTHICGGTLIEPSHVLTAGHCLEQKIDDRFVPLTSTNPTLESFFILRIGVHDIRLTQSDEIYRARRIYVHEKFISSTFENDIAVIRLDRPVPVTQQTTPICFPSSNVAPGKQVTVAGWGTVAETSRVHSNVLRQANVNILPPANCRVYMDVHYDSARQLCAAALDWSKDTW